MQHPYEKELKEILKSIKKFGLSTLEPLDDAERVLLFLFNHKKLSPEAFNYIYKYIYTSFLTGTSRHITLFQYKILRLHFRREEEARLFIQKEGRRENEHLEW
jgi:hypothetical protein